MTDSECSHHSRPPPYGSLSDSISFLLLLLLSSLMDSSLDLCSGVPAKVIFLRCPLITNHLVFMAQVFITLLVAHWRKDENFLQQYALLKWNYPPGERRREGNDRFAGTYKTRRSSADEWQWSWLDTAYQKSFKWVITKPHCALCNECVSYQICIVLFATWHQLVMTLIIIAQATVESYAVSNPPERSVFDRLCIHQVPNYEVTFVHLHCQNTTVSLLAHCLVICPSQFCSINRM